MLEIKGMNKRGKRVLFIQLLLQNLVNIVKMMNTYNPNGMRVLFVYHLDHGWGVSVCIDKVPSTHIK